MKKGGRQKKGTNTGLLSMVDYDNSTVEEEGALGSMVADIFFRKVYVKSNDVSATSPVRGIFLYTIFNFKCEIRVDHSRGRPPVIEKVNNTALLFLCKPQNLPKNFYISIPCPCLAANSVSKPFFQGNPGLLRNPMNILNEIIYICLPLQQPVQEPEWDMCTQINVEIFVPNHLCAQKKSFSSSSLKQGLSKESAVSAEWASFFTSSPFPSETRSWNL